MNRGYFQIISSDERMLDTYVQTYNEIYPMLYDFVMEIKSSLLTRQLREEIKYTLNGYIVTATSKIGQRFAKPLMYHMITDIGLRLDSTSMIYYLIEVLSVI